MFGNRPLPFREYVVSGSLPLDVIHWEVFDFLRGRNDAVLSGDYAVSAYVDQFRDAHQLEIVSTRASELAEELGAYLGRKFPISVRVRSAPYDRGYCVSQKNPQPRNLADVRSATSLPPAQRVKQVLLPMPAELIAARTIAFHRHAATPKSSIDLRHLRLLLLTFPDLKAETGLVHDRLTEAGADEATFAVWRNLVSREIRAEEDE